MNCGGDRTLVLPIKSISLCYVYADYDKGLNLLLNPFLAHSAEKTIFLVPAGVVDANLTKISVDVAVIDVMPVAIASALIAVAVYHSGVTPRA